MMDVRSEKRTFELRLAALAISILAVTAAQAQTRIEGRVVDTNGRPVAQAQVVMDRDASAVGPDHVTVFADANGHFRFPGTFAEAARGDVTLNARALGYEQVDSFNRAASDSDTMSATLVVSA